MTTARKFILWFDEVDKEDINAVGGKGANLGEMTKIGMPVPNGFIVTSFAYYYFLEKGGFKEKIKKIIGVTDVNNPVSLNEGSEKIKKLIIESPVPKDLATEIINAYLKLGSFLKDALVAVRSSATAEDLPSASFAGQQETFLDIKGESNVVQKVRECWASLFTARAIFYREQNKFDHFKVGIAVPVQKMVESEASGIMFTVDPVNSDKKKIVIEAIYGLGELIVQGKITPDHYEVEKDSLKLIEKQIQSQELMLAKKGSSDKMVKVPKKIATRQKIENSDITKLAILGKKLEKHYFFPQDIEWAKEKGKLFIVQTRPITTIKDQKDLAAEDRKRSEEGLKTLDLLLEGAPASPGIASGFVKIIKNAKEIDKVLKGEILVSEQTNPDFVPAMKRAAAIVTDRGGRTSHAAIVSRELGIPCVVGTEKGTAVLKTGMLITVDGREGKIFRGSPTPTSGVHLPAIRIPTETNRLLKTATKLYVNLAEPEKAQSIAIENVDGVGLLRAEFMIAEIGVHPKKLIANGKQKIFVEKLAKGLETFAAAFNPRPVIYRATDFKTNEYRNLKGGELYEPIEPNPMLGYRGAFRYINDPKVFSLELDAIKYVRNKLGYKNLWLMVPFVRTPKELIEVKSQITSAGLPRGSSFKLFMMVEIPSNVILLDKFIEVGIDGVSIGSNDLTMLILGTDRDNSEVASEYDERNEAVYWALERTIKTCKESKITCSICGQAPSVFPDFTEKLVEWGITSVSVNPDAIEQTRQIIYEAEKKLVKHGKDKTP